MIIQVTIACSASLAFKGPTILHSCQQRRIRNTTAMAGQARHDRSAAARALNVSCLQRRAFREVSVSRTDVSIDSPPSSSWRT